MNKNDYRGVSSKLRIGEKGVWCDHCHRSNHNQENYWRLHGRPANFQPRRQGNRQVFQAAAEETKRAAKIFMPSTQTQLNVQPSTNQSCSFAQKGSFSYALTSKSSTNDVWIIDSGALDHTTGNHGRFSTYNPCSRSLKIQIAYGSLSSIAGKGTVFISP